MGVVKKEAPTVTRAFALILVVVALPAGACVLPVEAAPSACAVVRLAEGHVCIDDPSAPGGYRIEARSGLKPAQPRSR